MSRSQYKGQRQKRDAGAFLAVPMAVLNSDAYIRLSASARSLLWDIACQLRGDNNGRLICSWAVMVKRGWRSTATLQKAKEELLASCLLFETRKGARPNKAAWYAVTWAALDAIDGMDVSPRAFPRGAYQGRLFDKETLKPLTSVSVIEAA